MTVHSYETSTCTCIGKSPIPGNINDPITSENASNACVLTKGGGDSKILFDRALFAFI